MERGANDDSGALGISIGRVESLVIRVEEAAGEAGLVEETKGLNVRSWKCLPDAQVE